MDNGQQKTAQEPSVDGVQERKNGDGSISYRVQIRKRGFPVVQKTFSQRKAAKEFIQDTKAAMRRGEVVSTKAQRTLLYEALERYGREITPQKKSALRELDRVKAWQRDPLAKRFLTQLDGDHFSAYIDRRRKDGVRDQTIRLELALISHLYTIARKRWRMKGLDNPIKEIELPGGSDERDRRLEEGEEEKLTPQLAAEGPYMAPLCALAIETAMRQGELLSLTSADLDLQKRIAHLADTKNSEKRDVPLSLKAIEILKALPRSLDDAAALFPISQGAVGDAFRRACTAAGIANLRFHDLRHEAVSRLFERGLNVAEVAAISGHKTWSQLKRYTQLKAADLARKLG